MAIIVKGVAEIYTNYYILIGFMGSEKFDCSFYRNLKL